MFREVKYNNASIAGGSQPDAVIWFGSAKDGSNNVIIPDSDSQHFSIQYKDRMWAVCDAPGNSTTWLDNHEFNEEAVVDFHLRKNLSVFIHAPSKELDNENSRFLIGFDPAEGEMWDVKQWGCRVEAKSLTVEGKVKGNVFGLHEVEFTIHPCEMVGIYGGSGSGKTTLIEQILGVANLPSQGGCITIDGKSPCEQREHISYLPQSLEFPSKLTCLELLKLAARDRGDMDEEKETAKIDRTLRLCSLDPEKFKSKQVGQLSGGERRRIGLAVALMKPSVRLLIADEPTSGLDVESERKIIATLRRISRGGITVIVVTHAAELCTYFDRVIVLRKHRDDQGSCIAFDGLWDEEKLNRHDFLKRHITNIDKLAYLSRSESASPCGGAALKFDSSDKWIRKPKVLADETPKSNGVVMRLSQANLWIGALRREQSVKTKIVFVFLSILCAIALQHGVAEDSDGACTLIILFSVAAPWLTATYVGIFCSQKLKFYAFENFSGLKTIPFVVAMFISSIRISFIISIVFTIGLWVMPNKEWEVLKLDQLCRVFGFSDGIINSLTHKEMGKSMPPSVDCVRAPFEQFITSGKQVNCYPGCSERTLESIYAAKQFEIKPSSIILESDEARRVKLNDELAELRKSQFHRYINLIILCLLGMFVICLAGSSIGIMLASLFKSAQLTTLAVVVLFISFLVFSRATISCDKVFVPLSELCAACQGDGGLIGDNSISTIVQMIASFFSLSRYGFNILCFHPVEYWGCVTEYIPLVLGCLLSLSIATVLLQKEKRIWKMLTRGG